MVRAPLLVLAALAALALVPAAAAGGDSARFDAAVSAILAEPYQPDYVPTGFDSAFDTPVANTAPAEDYTTGSIPDSPDYPAWPAAFSQVLFHSGDGAYLAAQPGVGPVGVVGFSEGAQNTVLALAQDAHHVFSAGLTFSGPADQDTQIAQDPAATDALVALVTPDETTACGALADAAAYYGTTGFDILAHETAMHAQTDVHVPLLNFYSADDSLVPAFEAQMMDAYETGNPLQRTVELQRGEHAYFYDRWWQQRAILLYLQAMLPSNTLAGTTPTVNRTPGGAPASAQTVDLGAPARAWADAQLAPYTCDPSQGTPGAG